MERKEPTVGLSNEPSTGEPKANIKWNNLQVGDVPAVASTIRWNNLQADGAPVDAGASFMQDESAKGPTVRYRSETSPHMIDFFQKVMLTDLWLKQRDLDIKRAIAASKAENPKRKSPLTDDAIEQHVHKEFFAYEKEQIARFTALKNSTTPMDALTEEEKHLMQFKTVDEFVAASYLTDQCQNYIRTSQPRLWEDFNSSIKRAEDALLLSNNAFAMEIKKNPAVLRAVAVEGIFKKQYPGLIDELKTAASNLTVKDGVGYALTLLKKSSVLMNPSGAMVSLAINGILQTETMRPFRERASSSIGKAMNAYVKPGLHKALGFLPESTSKRVALGLAAASVIGLALVGVIAPDEAHDLYTKAVEWLPGSVDEAATSLSESTMSGQSHASSQALTDAIVGNDAIQQSVAPSGVPVESGLQQVPVDDISRDLDEAKPASTDDVLSQLEQVDIKAEPVDIVSALEQSSDPDELIALQQQLHEELAAEKALISGTESIPDGAYKIQDGDCLSVIAQEQLRAQGVPYNYTTIIAYAEKIAEANGIPNIDEIKSGNTLVFPPVADAPTILQEPMLSNQDDVGVDFQPLVLNMDVADVEQHDFKSLEEVVSEALEAGQGWDALDPAVTAEHLRVDDVKDLVAVTSTPEAPHQDASRSMRRGF